MIPESPWGIAYMGILFTLMPACLFSEKRRGMAILMICLWLITRISFVTGGLEFEYMAASAAFTMSALFLAFFKKKMAIPFCFASISFAGFLASYQIIDLEIAGSVYELFGIAAMIIIIDPSDSGHVRYVLHLFRKRLASIPTVGRLFDSSFRSNRKIKS